MTDDHIVWQEAPLRAELSYREVHIWRVQLATDARIFDRLRGILSDDERAKAERFLRDEDRGRFIATHHALRHILARYLSVSPDSLRFFCSPTGKLSLSGVLGSESVQFNLSHSHRLGLIAVAWNRAVGVDVERIQYGFDYAPIAQGFFSDREQAALEQQPTGSLKSRTFFECWTGREAVLKAIGVGLSGLDVAANDQSELWSEWRFMNVDVDQDYAAAVAFSGDEATLACWNWPDYCSECIEDHGL